MQAGRSFTLHCGEIGIVSGQLPFRLAFPMPVSRIIAVVPKQPLDMRAPWFSRAIQRKIGVDAPFMSLIKGHLQHLADERSALSVTEATLLTENLYNLLAVATAPDSSVANCSSELQLAAILSYCRQNLGDFQLSPACVAARFGISVRTVHLRFRSVGRSFSRWVIESRLDACSTALKDARDFNTSISSIAYRNGFSDLSHFNKTFRARFDMTPSEWRAARQPNSKPH
jgi:AraC-like DNA-binding protein